MRFSTHAPLRALLLAAAACALPPTSALAEADPTTVDSVIVTARRDPDDPPVVAAARDRLSETPGAVSVIAAETYAARYALGLADILRDAPGVYAQKKWGGDMRLSIRGSGVGNNSHNRGVLLAQDGVPFNEADGYGDFQLIDPLIARYTQVWKGGNALRFGGALLGGAVDLVTPTGRTAGAENLVRLEAGSDGVARQHVEVARTAGDWDLFAAATNGVAQGYRRQSQQNLQYASLNVGRAFGEDRQVRLIVSGGHIDQEIPGALTLAQALNTPRAPNAGNYAGDYHRNMRSLRGVLQADWRLGDRLAFQGGVYGVWKDLDHPIFQVIDQESRNFGAFGRFDWAGEVGGRGADAFFGAWVRAGDLDAQQFVNLAGARGARQAASRQNARAYDLFAEGRLFATGRLALVAGASLGRAERDYRSYALPGVASSFNLAASKTYGWFAPRVGVIWQGDGGAQLFANLTRSVEPPNFSALSPTAGGFAPLSPQEAWTAEAGARGRRGALTWDVAVYRAALRRELLSFTVDPAHPATTFNAGDTVHQGIEAGLDWRIGKGLRLRQTYMWSDFRFAGDPQYGGNRLPVVPEHFYRAGLKYEHPAGWFVEPTLEWAISDVWADFRNTVRAPGYAVWSLNAGTRLGAHARAYVDIRNLTGEAYVSNVNSVVLAAPATAAFWPGDGRSAVAGLTVSF